MVVVLVVCGGAGVGEGGWPGSALGKLNVFLCASILGLEWTLA